MSYESLSNTLSRTALITSGYARRLSVEKQSIAASSAITEMEKEFDLTMDEFEMDKSNYKNQPQIFEQKKKEIFSKYQKQLSGPVESKLFNRGAQQLDLAYTNKMNDLYQRRDIDESKIKAQNLILAEKDRLSTNPDEFSASLKRSTGVIQNSVLFTPEEKKAKVEAINNDFSKTAIERKARKIFDETNGSFIDKYEAANNFLNKKEDPLFSRGNLLDKDLEVILAKTQSWRASAKIQQADREREEDDQLDETFYKAFFDGLDKKNFSEVKDLLRNSDPHNERLPMYWYDRINRQEDEWDRIASGSSGKKPKLSREITSILFDLASDETKDISYKNRKVKEIFKDNSLDPLLFEDALSYVSKVGKSYQNPAFKASIDLFDQTMGNLGKGLKGKKLENFNNRMTDHKNRLVETMLEGEYSPEQMGQVAQNLTRELEEEALDLVIETPEEFSNVSLKNIDDYKTFNEVSKKIESGLMLGTRSYFTEDLHTYATFYDKVLKSIPEDITTNKGPLNGLKAVPGTYIEDGKPAYTISDPADNKRYLVQLKSDGKFYKFIQYEKGSSDGEWLEIDYELPKEIKEFKVSDSNIKRSPSIQEGEATQRIKEELDKANKPLSRGKVKNFSKELGLPINEVYRAIGMLKSEVE